MKILSIVLIVAACAISPPAPDKTAEHLRINPKDGLAYVWIPPGVYWTGCLTGDTNCFGWERKRAEIKIAEGFWIGRTEVTQLAFQHIMHANPSFYIGMQLPVDSVSWPAARTYCARIGMRLPSESEWEYAAYGGATEPPRQPLSTIAWYDPNSQDTTHPVGQKLPNGYGLFDMLGNVMEWVSDIGTAPEGNRLLKGGSFFNAARALRISNRLGAPEDLRHRDVGFRCAANQW
ncbi:formylglycine-generating enzyme family protein [Acidicapsa dinghuensis]|uniref:Formylglycine-generating enzyme family protein n=1 Tax=Acidicapsa dinghuensis TaxID=2218256 RepID=A0ABW1EHC6_9BACT|nr:formylglycine-generating enzyme family protein [Acidicapsa dinghuensis]